MNIPVFNWGALGMNRVDRNAYGVRQFVYADDYELLRDDVNALLRQIDINDFTDSNGHPLKMNRAVLDLVKRLTP